MTGLPLSLAQRSAERIRALIVSGDLRPGARLSEAAYAERLDVSRNTLREAFRILVKDGLLLHEANRGISVARPSMESILDIYRIRRIIEVQAVRTSYAGHPAITRMAEAVERARAHAAQGDWQAVGSANMEFHDALLSLADSPRLNAFYATLTVELRLVFGLVEDPQYLHEPFIEMNARLIECLRAGRPEAAADLLESYLLQSERMLVSAFTRL
ncbi:GntR family transcriptional regulator [Thioclava sp. GXIMD2076]|uniref:GntR family transcriptional regulator n=1 Tax=Thioclava sp. GXIMD2076 TaxID=3131931 RepID=UPI0030D22DF8